MRGILENHKSNFGVYITEKNIINFWFELEKSSLDSYKKIDNEDIEEI